MNHQIDLQIACQDTLPVSEDKLLAWVTTALDEQPQAVEITLRLVDIQEITTLNNTYRKKNKPTNVLAFPCDIPDNIELELPLLGDVIICPAVLQTESELQNTPLEAHWAHIIIHGVLHLSGFDHQREDDSLAMQTVEIKLLAKCGFANPYHQEGNDIE